MAKRKAGKKLVTEINEAVATAIPEPLTLDGRQPRQDHVANIAQLIEWGQARLAADHLLFPEMNGNLTTVMSGVLRRVNAMFFGGAPSDEDSDEQKVQKIRLRGYCYEYLLETVLNFLGLESNCLDPMEKSICLEKMYTTMLTFEMMEQKDYGSPEIAKAVIGKILDGMKLVQGGASMVAKTAVRIEKKVKGANSYCYDFLAAAEEELEHNIYFVMAELNYCKFGNDYALGLRWLRHLGFEQVSTNPVLAAKAYEDDPSIVETFKREVVKDANYDLWESNPDKYADAITLCATLFALWDNLHVYRPVFYNLSETTGGGVVSFQLNPNIADQAQESIEDAMNALALAQRELEVYDAYLLAGYSDYCDTGRPNMVIKVAASHPAAREIARTINSYGLGSNITVVYTVAQQVVMVLEEMAGMAIAMHRGIMPTQLYMTNMGGRLESHLREVVLAELFDKLKKKIGVKKALEMVEQLGKANGSIDKVNAADTYEDKVFAATCYGAQKTIDANVCRALKDVSSKDGLMLWEDDIAKSGTLVARRTWHIFFSEKNREKWVEYLCAEFDLDPDQAEFIMSRINYLPASKRKPEDTFWTLTSSNMVHTEFGNHQENVLQMAAAKDFDLLDYVESIRDSFDPSVVERLNVIPDFPIAYEINAEIAEVLAEVGIKGDFGKRGHKPQKWGEFGSVQKTSGEFRAAYDAFKEFVLDEFPLKDIEEED